MRRMEMDLLDRFRSAYERDRAAGAVGGLGGYLERFPGDAEAVARAFFELEGRTIPTGPAGGPGADGSRVGPYVIEREIGRGGQGVVYLARDTRIDRGVALKVLTHVGPGSESVLARFRREAEITSKLDHPGICAVLDAAIEGSVPYIAMRYVEGRSLADAISRARSTHAQADDAVEGASSIISLEDEDEAAASASHDDGPPATPATPTRREVARVLKIFEAAGRALHVAHEAGVVHRDIKPGNILVTGEDQPVLLDFGLAHDEEGEGPSLTRSGDLFGTPAYMSPEQLMAQRIVLDRRTDVWSLAVTLFECLTLHRPFEAPTREALYQAIMTREPRDPRALNPALPSDLKVVLETALEKDRDRRYATALEFAEELRRVRCHEPIHARPAGPVLRLRRWTQRNPALAALVASLLLLLPAASWFAARARGESERARLSKGKADAEEALRERIEAEARDLAWADTVRRFVARIDDVTSHVALLHIVLDSNAAYARQAEGFLAAFRDLGLDLEAGDDETLLRRFEELRARDAKVARLALNTIQGLSWMASRVPDAEGETRTRMDRVTAAIRVLVNRVEVDPWYLRVRAAQRDASLGTARFDALMDEAEATQLSADKLVWLADTYLFAHGGPSMDKPIPERVLALLDRAIDLTPDDFGLRFMRGGYAMAAYSANPDAAQEALRHFGAALAVRPDSGVAWSMVGMIRGALGQYLSARRAADQATERDPTDALSWYFRGRFYAYGNTPESRLVSRQCFERALELDPSFSSAREALDLIEAGKPLEGFGPRRQ